jgi:von Willebrand factor type A domain
MLALQFLTPLAALFVFVAAVPLAGLFLTERRAAEVRALLRLHAPGRRALLPVAIALVLLPALVAVAAAQPVVVREQKVTERADAQAFVVIDTSGSMRASTGPRGATRLARAKRIALELQHALPDVPFGIASMTDRSLPNIMPTVDRTLFERTIAQSVGIDRPPPSQPHPNGRASSFEAIVPLVESHFFSQGVQRRVVVVLTDGEAGKVSPVFKLTLHRRVTPVFVHVWEPGEQIFAKGVLDPKYVADPSSRDALAEIGAIAHGNVYQEHEVGKVVGAVREAVGHAQGHTHVAAYARVPLAPWFVLAAGIPLAFLLWRRNA